MTVEQRVARMREVFQRKFPSIRIVRFFEAPGRVNLLGSHLDSNGGFELSMCIDRSVIVGIQPNDKAMLRFYSMDTDAVCECPADKIARQPECGWADGALGAAWALGRKGAVMSGFDLVMQCDIPPVNGLGPSAALASSAALALTVSLHQVPDRRELALLCAYAGNEFLKAHHGATEYLPITLSEQGKAVFVDCRNLRHDLVPFSDPDVTVAVCCPHRTAESPGEMLEDRRRDCLEGVRLLINYVGFIRHLRDISVEQFETLKYHLPEKIMKRCAHIVYENFRAMQAMENMRKRKFKELGALMNESHRSLKDLYEVSCPELDCLAEEARGVKGVFGSRMTGSGLDGCTVNVMRMDAAAEFEKTVKEKYREKFGEAPSVFKVEAGGGTREVTP